MGRVADPISLSFLLTPCASGPKGGLAIAEALAGAIVPSGRLPYKYVLVRWFLRLLCDAERGVRLSAGVPWSTAYTWLAHHL
jgi:hypothetical protein